MKVPLCFLGIAIFSPFFFFLSGRCDSSQTRAEGKRSRQCQQMHTAPSLWLRREEGGGEKKINRLRQSDTVPFLRHLTFLLYQIGLSPPRFLRCFLIHKQIISLLLLFFLCRQFFALHDRQKWCGGEGGNNSGLFVKKCCLTLVTPSSQREGWRCIFFFLSSSPVFLCATPSRSPTSCAPCHRLGRILIFPSLIRNV